MEYIIGFSSAGNFPKLFVIDVFHQVPILLNTADIHAAFREMYIIMPILTSTNMSFFLI